jgi:hypothetical protein
MIKAPAKRKPQPSVAMSGNGKRDARKSFWRRPSHPELDRAGDFILKNLDLMREEATARGDSR